VDIGDEEGACDAPADPYICGERPIATVIEQLRSELDSLAVDAVELRDSVNRLASL
jgi:hypothetical protein